jgi:hypothetical protein
MNAEIFFKREPTLMTLISLKNIVICIISILIQKNYSKVRYYKDGGKKD